MSQYPYSPQQQPPYGYGGYPQDPRQALLAPAKRASVMMFIMAGIMLPCGALFGLFSLVDLSQLPPQQIAQFQQIEQQLGIGVKTVLHILAFGMLIPGALFLILGIVVRRGGLASTIISIILCCIFALFAVISVIGGLLQVGQAGAQSLLGVLIWGVFLVMLIFTLTWLFQAAKNSGPLHAYAAPYPTGQSYIQNPAYPQTPSQQPQVWQQPGQWNQPNWPPTPPPPGQQNWPPPSNPT